MWLPQMQICSIHENAVLVIKKVIILSHVRRDGTERTDGWCLTYKTGSLVVLNHREGYLIEKGLKFLYIYRGENYAE